MNQLLMENVVRERHSAMLREAEAERRAAQQLKVTRAWRRLERAQKRLETALEDAYALPAKPNPVTNEESAYSAPSTDRAYEKQLV